MDSEDLKNGLLGRAKELAGVAAVRYGAARYGGPAIGRLHNDFDAAKALMQEAKKNKYVDKFFTHGRLGNSLFIPNPESTEIYLGRRHFYKPGVVAHEIGHAINFKKTLNTKNLWHTVPFNNSNWIKPSALGGAGTLIAAGDLLSDNQRAGIAALSTAGTLPSLIEESKASWNGYKMMRGIGKGKLASLGAFIGLPSYLGYASLPSIAYFLHSKPRN